MRTFRLIALAAALVAPAAAHAQLSVYVGPSSRHIALGYHQGYVGAPRIYGPVRRYWVPTQPVWGGYNGWRAHRYWSEHRGYDGRRW